MNKTCTLISTAAALFAALPAWAQQESRALQENGPRGMPPPAASAPLQLTPPAPPMAPTAGGMRVEVRQIIISGNSVIPESELLAILGKVSGSSYDFAGLRDLAERLSRHYRASGYPFARAYLPQQDLQNGVLHIQILEGRYGKVTAHGDAGLAPGAQRFLSSLQPGAVIESHLLERVTLILDDQPGVRTIPTVRPGQAVGEGDLSVAVQRANRYKGEAGVDNDGNRYTGRRRAHLNVDIDSPFTLGDQIALQGMYTEEDMWFGSVSYALPLGSSGLRGRAAYTRSYYALADSFAALDASGTADVASAGLSYPLLRSQPRNLTLSANIEHKRLHDRQGATDVHSEKTSNSFPVALNFDFRDALLRGAVSYGALTWTPGRLTLNGLPAVVDSVSARSAGSFAKVNLDVARIQSVTDRIDLYGRLSAQWANKNLDSSQKFGLGGRNGVRAYPSGEGYGDAGALAQFEARYAAGPLVPYVFYDFGHEKTNRSPWTTEKNTRSIAGAGAGLRFAHGRASGGVTLAWRTSGGAARSEPDKGMPTVWANLAYRF